MFKKTPYFVIILIVIFASKSFAQLSGGYTETTLIDEFSILPECDTGSRFDQFIIELANNPESKGYVIMYRGTDDILARQSDNTYENQLKRLQTHMLLRKFDLNRVEFINGGFRKSDYFAHSLWIVPKGGEIPQPEDTVPRPKKPTTKPYLADRSSLDFYEVSFEYINSKTEIETDLIEFEDTLEELEFIDESENDLSEKDEKLYPEPDPTETFVSDVFIDELEKNKTSKGIIYFYADEEEFHLGNAEEALRKELQIYGQKNKFDLSRIRLIFGGFRQYPKAEFWIVPKNAPDPIPTPENKKENAFKN